LRLAGVLFEGLLKASKKPNPTTATAAAQQPSTKTVNATCNMATGSRKCFIAAASAHRLNRVVAKEQQFLKNKIG
jgi:hypothetical protein